MFKYLFLLCTFFYSCNNNDSVLCIKNESNSDIYYIIDKDSSISEAINYLTWSINENLIARKNEKIYPYSPTSWDYYIQTEFKDSIINIFIINESKLNDKLRILQDSDYLKKEIKRYRFSLKELKEMNWEFDYNEDY